MLIELSEKDMQLLTKVKEEAFKNDYQMVEYAISNIRYGIKRITDGISDLEKNLTCLTKEY